MAKYHDLSEILFARQKDIANPQSGIERRFVPEHAFRHDAGVNKQKRTKLVFYRQHPQEVPVALGYSFPKASFLRCLGHELLEGFVRAIIKPDSADVLV